MVELDSKGLKPQKVKVPTGVFKGVDLRTLPKYICFKAAKELQDVNKNFIILIYVCISLIIFTVLKYEQYQLIKLNRTKEFILAPSNIIGFTPVVPQGIPDSYVEDATTTFLSLLGNVNPTNIDENYTILRGYMSPSFDVKFLAMTKDWVSTVLAEGISEIITVSNKEIIASKTGHYKMTALVRRERYVNSEFLGHADEVIEIELQLVPPKEKKQWHLQVNSLTRVGANRFK